MKVPKDEFNIEEFYKKYGPMVLRRCKLLLKDEEKALDAMQDVFVKLIKNKNKLHGTYASSLLYTIATNTCLNIIKKENSLKITSSDAPLDYIASSENIEDKFILKDLINLIFKNEKSSTREIAVMHYIDKMTLAEVANRSGLSVSGVRKRLMKLKENAKSHKGVIL